MRVGDETLVSSLTPAAPPPAVRPGPGEVSRGSRLERLRTWPGWTDVLAFGGGFVLCMAADRWGFW